MVTMTKSEISLWLKEKGKDRHWLAKQIGCTYGTLTQWFSKGFPEWALKSVNHLASPDNTAGLEIQFSPAEFEIIEQARGLTGHATRAAFYKDGIIDYAEKIIQAEARESSPKPEAPTVKSGAPSKTAPPAGSSNISKMPPQHLRDRAADEPGDDSELPPPNQVNYGSGKRKKKGA